MVPYLRNVSVQWGRIDTENVVTMELDDRQRDRFGIKSGDLLVCEGGEIGRCAVWHGRDEYIAFQKALHRIRPNSCLDVRFLRYLLEYYSLNGTLARLSTGSTIAHLPQQQLRKVPVPIPPIPEQHRIVDVLEDHFSRLDSAETMLNAVERRARMLSDWWIDAAILGKTSGTPMISPPGASLRGKYGRFDFQSLPNLPQGWKWRLSESVCKSINSGSTPSADRMQQGHGDVPFLKVYNIAPAGHVDFSKNPTFISGDTHRRQLGRSVTRPGDVVTNIVGPPLGKSAVVPDSYEEWNHNQAIVSFRAGEEVEPAWLATCMRSRFVVDLLKSTARATAGQFNIALSTCRELPLPLPPIDVQRSLLSDLSNQQTALHHACFSVVTARSRSKALRRSLLRAAFNGELVEQDPNDEPAEVALARIRDQPKPTRKRGARRSPTPSKA